MALPFPFVGQTYIFICTFNKKSKTNGQKCVLTTTGVGADAKKSMFWLLLVVAGGDAVVVAERNWVKSANSSDADRAAG